jgi:Sulfotransferase domain
MTQSVKNAGRQGLLQLTSAFGTITSPVRTTPSLVIVGAQRCGTTSMFKALRQHPAVVAPALRKGIHYFDNHYRLGEGWYRAHFPLQVRMQLAGRRAGVEALTLESSPFYMFHPLAAERLARDLPNVRLLVLVRDPVERAYSAHAHETARGYETETFEHAVELESSRTAGEAERMTADPDYDSFDLQHHAYLARGRYVEQLRRLEKLVGRDRLHVVDSQEFFVAPQHVMSEVATFLSIPQHQGMHFEQHNARARSPMPESLRTELQEHFRPYDEELRHWLGREPTWRR